VCHLILSLLVLTRHWSRNKIAKEHPELLMLPGLYMSQRPITNRPLTEHVTLMVDAN